MASEKRTCKDRSSGVEVTQLTDYRGHSHHLYFTNPGWYDGGRKLLFSSDRNNRTNLYGLNLADGNIEQLTDLEPPPPPKEHVFLGTAVNPTRDEAYFWNDTRLTALDLATGKQRVLCEIETRWRVSMTNCSADGRCVYFGTWEVPPNVSAHDLRRGYIGFRDIWAARPQSQITEVRLEGSGARVVYEERCWIGHVNTSPTQAHLLSFCHEGPWIEVDQRIWVLDVRTGQTWKVRPTQAGERVGHEYWYADGLRLGYHGSVNGKPLLGRIRCDGTERHEESFPGETGHIFSHDERLIVGDGGKLIRLWKWDGERYAGPRLLCRHDSTMHIQQSHAHPASLSGRIVRALHLRLAGLLQPLHRSRCGL